ncbi:NOG1 nucleolar GTP-binding [Tubulinosema ratisbonensis]|uniref:NOG1 nucleolar GTP-binding n=1 Tax=Tubulinosema ratisbonensis TaxID=291195 RepID=A0A437ANL8_9MICR|nr:NOG1 nucleolar GTP-binding [Tubulinosema ratisbonensis]
MKSNFKAITPVPSSTHLIDIVLNSTQRKTPTMIKKSYKIQRVRQIYMKKVKFCSNQIKERMKKILDEFPRTEDVHPFYSDLINVLYDKDHYKMALGHCNTSKGVIEKIEKEFLNLLKYGDSLYRCKQLKKAALGKMASALKKLTSSLEYLEEVRQHLSRIPTIDTTKNTLLICGYPNVGKSSFITQISKAKVEIQPYPFTTKNLFVGHYEKNGETYQVIDTPGILDHPLEERNNIEMQSIVALAHLNSTVLFFIDLSESCGYFIQDQISLFNSLKPLIKECVVILSKTDLKKLTDLETETKILVDQFLSEKDFLEISVNDLESIEKVKEKCSKNTSIETLIINPTISYPKEKIEYVPVERESIVIPEIFNGKNVADFLDADILQKLHSIKPLNVDKTYDVLPEEGYKIKEYIHDAIENKRMEHKDKRRQTLPAIWKERVVRRESAPLVKSNYKPVKKEKIYTKPIDKKPSHLFKRKRVKHGNRRR